MRAKVQALKRDISGLRIEMAETNRLITMYVALTRQLGLPPQIIELIAKAQQARITIQMLQRSIMLFYASTGPVGWAIGLGGVAVGALMLSDMMTIRRPRY